MEQMMIKTHGLGCQAGFKYLLKDINWEVRQGEHWAVFGMNGCGKTTLLSVLAGFKQPTAGDVRVLGKNYSQDNILALRQRIGWVSGSFFEQKYTKESAQDIVLSGKFGTLGLGRPITDGDRKRARSLLKALHLGRKIDQPFHLMSKGERQNVLIARALMAEPEILLLDEPCTGLDILAREQLLSTLRSMAQEGRMMMEAKIDQDVIPQLAQQKTVDQPAQLGIQFLPEVGPDISWTGGEMSIRYEMYKLNFDWRMNQMQFTFVPGDIEFKVTQQPDVVIKYIGGPLYVPPSADPNYEPLDTKA